MASFLVDEDLPRWLAASLRDSGHQAEDVRDAGLGGRSDQEIHQRAVETGQTILTGDVEFGGLSRHPVPPGGTLLVRMSDTLSADLRVKLICAYVNGLERDDLAGHLGVVEPGGLRLRKVT